MISDEAIKLAEVVNSIVGELTTANGELVDLLDKCGEPLSGMLSNLSMRFGISTKRMIDEVGKKLLDHARAGLL